MIQAQRQQALKANDKRLFMFYQPFIIHLSNMWVAARPTAPKTSIEIRAMRIIFRQLVSSAVISYSSKSFYSAVM